MEFLGGGSQAAQQQQTQQGGIVSISRGSGTASSTTTSHHDHLDSNGGGGSQSSCSSSVYGGGGGLGLGGSMVMDFGTAGVMMMSSTNNSSSARHCGGGGSASSSSNSDSDGGHSGFDINMSSLNVDSTSLLAESLDAFLSYGDEEPPKQVPLLLPLPQHQTQQQMMQPSPPLMQQQQQQQQQGVATTSTVNNLFSFHPQLGLVAAAGTFGMPQQPLPSFAVAPVSATNIASLLAGGGGASSGTTSSSMAAAPPPPPPRVAKSASAKRVSTTTKSIAAVTSTTARSSSTSAPLVPTLFGRAVSLPPVSGPSRPLQLSPWEIEQAKKQKSSAGARGGVSSSAAAAASSSCSPVTTTTTPHLSLSQMQQKRNAAKKRPRHAAEEGGGGDDGISAVSEDERRQDRNQREQNRSQQITHQIDHLRNVLAAANVPFKPDKHNTLVSVVQYIKELQEQSKGLDEEHDKLLQTITDTSEIMNNQYLPAQTTGTGVPTLEDTSGVNKPEPTASSVAGDPTLFLLQGVDFKFIFQRCPVASAVTSIDGRFLDCNGQFEQICGVERQELLVASEPPHEDEKAADAAHTTTSTEQPPPPAAAAATKNLSLFNILQQSDMERVYTAMSHMLQRPMFMNINSDKKSDSKVSDDMWTEQVSLCRMDKAEVRLTLSLVRSPQEGRPRFFNCVLIAKDSD